MHPIVFEVFESLPRQGPGNLASAERALALCAGLPHRPRILDLGCGSGAQTLHLAQLTTGSIVAVDAHAPLIEQLQNRAVHAGIRDRIDARVGDMQTVPASGEFDLVWSEGALYNLGMPAALARCADLVAPGGYLVFTEAVWRSDDPPAIVRAMFADYPGMGRVTDVLTLAEQTGWTVVEHFDLPDEAWWDDFYGPMEQRIAELRARSAVDLAALAALDELALEPQTHRTHGAHYGYTFFVLRR